MWPALFFAAVVVLIIVVVLVGTWPTEREERLRMAATEIAAAVAERNTAEFRARVAEEFLTPDQAELLERKLADPRLQERPPT
jgi:hypothetical protein